MSKTSFLIGISICILIFACAKKGENQPTTNAEIPVTLLFEHDGCKVYRFEDIRYHYFTTCQGSVSSEWTEGCGKNCRRTITDENQTTVRARKASHE